MVTVVVCTGIFLATGGLLVFAVWRFRSRPGHTETSLSHLHGNPQLEGALIVIVALLLLIIAVPNLRVLFAASTRSASRSSANSGDGSLPIRPSTW
jgi:heme/copper-type cytochrome/quinol oxidase subunit 2